MYIIDEFSYSPHQSIVEQALIFHQSDSLHNVIEVLKGGIQIGLNDFCDSCPELLYAYVILHAELE